MSRRHKITIVIFCIGVLLCGIGAGIAFTEFSGLTYGGTQILGESEIVTKDLDVDFEQGKDVTKIVGIYNYGGRNVETDSSVPVNTVRFRTTYNAKIVAPFAEMDADEGRILFGYYRTDRQADMALMMEAKDIVLQNLKEGRLVSFDAVEMEEVEVLVNPKCAESVRIGY